MNRTKITSVFKFICLAIASVMVGYWFYKYEIEDRDVGVVDYRSFDESTNDFRYPVLTLCIENPFIKHKAKNKSSDSFYHEYLKYLKGEVSNDEIGSASYENSTINLNNYFIYALEKWNNDSQWRNSSLIFSHANVFNGFYIDKFLKCFSIESNIESNRHIKKIKVYYKTISTYYHSVFYKVHYPGQFLLGDILDFTTISSKFSSTRYNRFIIIRKVEVLKRRSNRNKKCSVEPFAYDEKVLNQHVKLYGCSPPYISEQKGYPTCNASEIRKSRFVYENAKNINHLKDCHRISEVRTEVMTYINKDLKKSLYVGLSYPEEIKIITQSREVDIHSLIGNIGGYIGLFLGNYVLLLFITLSSKLYLVQFHLLPFQS